MKIVDRIALSIAVGFQLIAFTSFLWGPIYAHAFATPDNLRPEGQIAEKQTEETLCLIDKTDAPFVIKQEDGTYSGYAIDLMNSIKEKTGIACKYQEVNGGIPEQLKMVANGAGDIALGSITITSGREENIDFSHSYFSSEIGALYKDAGVSTFATVIRLVKEGLILIVGLVFLFYLVGLISHMLDRKEGITSAHDGAWWAIVTFATVGYGDIVPKTGAGRLFASIWILLSMSLLAVYTGYVSSVFVVDNIGTTVTYGDLYNKRVVSISGTTSEALLNDTKVKAQFVASTLEALELLKSDKVDAIVYDRPLLEYISKTNPDLKLGVCGLEVGQEQYGFVLKQNSKMREKINVAMLEILNSKEWKARSSKYF